METNWYMKFVSNHCAFIKRFGDNDFIILQFDVDDMLIEGHDKAKIESLNKNLNKSLDMKDLGQTKQTLGTSI